MSNPLYELLSKPQHVNTESNERLTSRKMSLYNTIVLLLLNINSIISYQQVAKQFISDNIFSLISSVYSIGKAFGRLGFQIMSVLCQCE